MPYNWYWIYFMMHIVHHILNVTRLYIGILNVVYWISYIEYRMSYIVCRTLYVVHCMSYVECISSNIVYWTSDIDCHTLRYVNMLTITIYVEYYNQFTIYRLILNLNWSLACMKIKSHLSHNSFLSLFSATCEQILEFTWAWLVMDAVSYGRG